MLRIDILNDSIEFFKLFKIFNEEITVSFIKSCSQST